MTVRSVFSNPFSPLTDVFLWIGVRFISCAHASSGVLLIGDSDADVDPKHRPKTKEYAYGKWMRKALNKAQGELEEAGMLEEVGHLAHELSPHSFKKECEERLTTEPGGPPATSAFLRCGQNLNAVLRRYVRDDKYSDELCGRITAGFRTHDVKFGTLPPHFDTSKIPKGFSWGDIYPGYSDIKRNYPKFAKVLKYCAAAVVYHHHWLLENLPPDHAFFSSAYYQEDFHKLLSRPGCLLSGEMECPVTGMTATGVPLYISNSIRVNSLTTRVAAAEAVLNEVKQTQDELVREMKKLRKSTKELR
jgi:hypothetical protein